MTRPNVRVEGSDVVHAHAITDRPFTRCAVIYDGVLCTEDPVDCMACLVKDEWANADIREIILSNPVKDIQEAVERSLC